MALIGAEISDVAIVGIVAGGTEDQEITTISFFAEPAKSLIQILAAAHHRSASLRFCLDIILVTQTEVLPGMSGSRIGSCEVGNDTKRQAQQQRQVTRKARRDRRATIASRFFSSQLRDSKTIRQE